MVNGLGYDLVLPSRLWDSALRELLPQRNRVAVGICHRNRHWQADELLVETLRTADDLPSGERLPPLSDWVVLGTSEREDLGDIQAWVNRLKPRNTQLLAVALVGLGPERAEWNGAVVENGVLRPIRALRVVGSGMVQASYGVSDDQPELLAQDGQHRWSRTRGALGEATWQKIAATRVLLIGAGRTGSTMAFHLTALGIQSLTLVDPDRLEMHNLDAGCCVTEQDLGRAKTDALQNGLHAFRSDCAIASLPRSATDRCVAAKAAGVDLIVTCVDHDTPRLVAARLARRYLKIHLDVGTGIQFDAESGDTVLAGDVRLMLPRMGCVCCVGGLRDEANARYELAAPPGALPRRASAAWHQQRTGSLITLNSLTVATAVQTWLDLLAGRVRTSLWQRLRWEPGHGLQTSAAPVGAAPSCPICSESSGW